MPSQMKTQQNIISMQKKTLVVKGDVRALTNERPKRLVEN